MMNRLFQAPILACVAVVLTACSNEPNVAEPALQEGGVASQSSAPIAAKVDPAQTLMSLPNGVRTADNGVPLVRAGLWESEVEGGGGVKMQFCRQSPSSQNDAWFPLSLTAAGGCERTRSIVNDTLRVITRCDAGPNARNETEMTFKGSETEYETSLTMTSIRSGETHAMPSTVLRERWVGDCPADMKDGDRKVVTG